MAGGPEELFVVLQDCNLDILPWISNASWKQFASTPYNDDAVKCLLRKYYCPEENLSVSTHPYWKKIGTRFDADRKSLDQNLSLQDETFMLVFIEYFNNDYSRFRDIIYFLKTQSLLSEYMRTNILAHFRGSQDQSYLRYHEAIGFASSYCSIL